MLSTDTLTVKTITSKLSTTTTPNTIALKKMPVQPTPVQKILPKPSSARMLQATNSDVKKLHSQQFFMTTTAEIQRPQTTLIRVSTSSKGPSIETGKHVTGTTKTDSTMVIEIIYNKQFFF